MTLRALLAGAGRAFCAGTDLLERHGIATAREREDAACAELVGGPADLEALAASAEGREPDFTALPPGW